MLLLILLYFYNLFFAYSLEQLAFSGGGAFGAVEIGILKRILEIENKEFDLYTGISAGALNAGFLSYYSDVYSATLFAENIYSSINNRMIYSPYPSTTISILNTQPLRKTLTDILKGIKNKPIVHTLIGTVSLDTGFLDIYQYETLDTISQQVDLLMASSAIPIIFPPIYFNDAMHVDGGTLSNELLQVEHDNTYLNITYITPSESYIISNDEPLDTLEKIAKRVITIVINNFNDPFVSLNTNCKKPIGEINKYYVEPIYLEDYNMLNFDTGAELVDIGYKYMKHKKYNLC